MLQKISYDVIFNPSKQHRSGDGMLMVRASQGRKSVDIPTNIYCESRQFSGGARWTTVAVTKNATTTTTMTASAGLWAVKPSIDNAATFVFCVTTDSSNVLSVQKVNETWYSISNFTLSITNTNGENKFVATLGGSLNWPSCLFKKIE